MSNYKKQYGLAKSEIIRRSEDISLIFQNGRFVRDRGLDAVFLPGEARKVAFATTKRIRTAVKRNRLKRRLREAFRLEKENFHTPLQFVLIGQENILTASFQELRETLRRLAIKIKVQALDESQRKGNRN